MQACNPSNQVEGRVRISMSIPGHPGLQETVKKKKERKEGKRKGKKEERKGEQAEIKTHN